MHIIKKTLKFFLRPSYRFSIKKIKQLHIKKETSRLRKIKKDTSKLKIFYFGITEHSNLGDLAQYYCIQKWLKENYPQYEIFEFESTTVIDSRFNFIEKLHKILNKNDIIFFQSGYTTQDLGGNHEYMHRLIIDNIPNSRIVFMPQTIFFREEKNKRITSQSYNQGKRTLFLARDRVSYEMALKMFPKINVKLFPDIVTSLIGHFKFSKREDKVLFCCRNDSEKLYSNEQIAQLRQKVEKIMPTEIGDTTIKVNYKKIRKNLQYYIEKEIETFSQYRLIITDRYHGNIFALAANTPVIILKTTDHKVITGAEWFKGVYDDYVYLADSLEDAFELSKTILNKKDFSYSLNPFFDKEYYSKLRKVIEKTI
ncbi:MAG: polysaccharide pyruvyl transferase family protein [Bacteroidetes bacterium]|nr:polysaccharide pyruvyl transferase family protein [Bacteroidota bacterium]